ncbi:MAG: PEGA domain-containing protein [Halanaerobacter sp.]
MRKSKIKMLGMTILLASLLLVVGCNPRLGSVRFEVKDEDGEHLTSDIKVSRAGRSRTKESSNGVAKFGELPAGEYEVEVTKEGYDPLEETVALQGQDLKYEVTLEEEKEAATYNLDLKVQNQEGEELDATAKLTGDSTDQTEEIKEGKLTIKDLAPGDYELAVTKEGYQDLTKEITIEDDLTTSIKLAKEEEEEADLEINVSDVNDNQLPAEIKVKDDDSVIEEKTTDKATFKDLTPKDYTIDISKSNYEDWTKEVTLEESSTTVDATLKGGLVRQHIIDADQNTVEIDDLKEGEEAIVGLSYLNWDSLDYDKVYPVRRKSNELIKEHGTNFANPERDYEKGDSKTFKLPAKVSDEEKTTAQLAGVGDNIYVFTAQDANVSEERVQNLINEFDDKISPALTNKKNIQGKVTVLLDDFSNYQMTGYFDPADLYPDLGNEEPMFYLNTSRSCNTLLTAAAHQHQHLNFFVDKAKAGRTANDAWIDQGLAQIAPQVLEYISPVKKGWSIDKGYDWAYNEHSGYLNNTSEVNLLIHDGSLPFTGAAGLFANYLVDNYGTEIVYEIVTSSQDPKDVIADYTGKSFNKVYLNWITTNVTDNLADVTNPVYNYSNFDLDQMPKFDSTEISTYGVNYFKVDEDEFEINPPQDFEGKIGVVIIRQPTE